MFGDCCSIFPVIQRSHTNKSSSETFRINLGGKMFRFSCTTLNFPRHTKKGGMMFHFSFTTLHLCMNENNAGTAVAVMHINS